MENKYYTPDLEEFCIGFTYESLQDPRLPNLDESWEENIIEYDFIDTFWKYYKENCSDDYRVKYLDKEDIENLGFESIGSAWYNLEEVSGELGYWCYVRMRFFNGDCLIRAYRYDPKTIVTFDKDETQILFDGVIKNKSELKKLMKQLKIT